MKKILISMLVLVPLLCGCTNVNTTLTLNKDKSATVTSVLNYDGNVLEKGNATAETIQNNYKKFLDDDYKVEINNKSDHSTIIAQKSVKNIKKQDLDLSSLGFSSKLTDGKYVEVKRNFFVTSYNIKLAYSLKNQIKGIKITDIDNVEGGLKPEYFQKYAQRDSISTNMDTGRADFLANFERNSIVKEDAKNATTKQSPKENDSSDFNASFSIKLPSIASYNNADTTDGTLYTWYLKPNKTTIIELLYVVYSGWAITFLLLAGIALLIYLARRILRHDANKRIGTNN